MTDALKHHWPEYLMEATCLGLFMVVGIYFRHNPRAPRFAGSPGHSKPAPAPPAHGNRHGTDRHQHYLFALG